MNGGGRMEMEEGFEDGEKRTVTMLPAGKII